MVKVLIEGVSSSIRSISAGIGMYGVGFIDCPLQHLTDVDLADAGFRAASTSVARVVVNSREVVGGVDGVKEPEAPRRDHGLTAATAAVADEGRPLPHVLAELGEALVLGLLQQVPALCGVDWPGEAVLCQGMCGVPEGQADLPARLAGPTDVPHLVAAVADADGEGEGPVETQDFRAFDLERSVLMLDAFATSVRARTPPAIDGWTGLQALAVVEALQRSAENGRSEKVPSFRKNQP